MSALIRRLLAVALVVTSAIVISPTAPTAVAAGTPDIVVTSSMPGQVLVGENIPITIEVANPGGPDGYNTLIRDVLPAGVSYVSGSSDPEPLQYPQLDGTTVLVWSNVADSITGTTIGVSYEVSSLLPTYDAGAFVENSASAYTHSNPRIKPRVDGDGTPIGITYTGNDDADPARTDIVPFTITKSEDNPEDEMLRGVHDHKSLYTLQIDNNLEGPTTNFNVVDYLPANLEFLGCGGVDNSADGTEEYPGAGRIDDTLDPVFAESPCVIPSSVTTETVDPDGSGPMELDVYTRVEWDAAAIAAARSSADLAPGGQFVIEYIAAIPLRENVDTDPDPATANLDNNTGVLTTETEGESYNYTAAVGTYDGVQWSDDDIDGFVAEDIRILKSELDGDGDFLQGDTLTYELDVATSEYALATGPITITDTIPNALDFVEARPTETSGPVLNPDGSQTITWIIDPGFADPSGSIFVEIETRVREFYRLGDGGNGTPVASRDSFENTTDTAAVITTMTDNDGSSTDIPQVDDSAAGSNSAGPVILKEVSEPVVPGALTCADGAGVTFDPTFATDYRPGDHVCYRLTVQFPDGLTTLQPRVRDFLPDGFELDTAAAGGGWQFGEANTVGAGDVTFADDSPVLAWSLADMFPDAATGAGQTFQVVVQTVVSHPTEIQPGDIAENLMKFSHRNTAGQVFQLRDDALAELSEAIVGLDKGIIELNGTPITGAPVDQQDVQEGDVVTYQIILSNTGNENANNVSVRDVLPGDITCAQVSAISDGGACDAGNDWIQWDAADGITVAAGGTSTLTYDVTVPTGISAGSVLVNTAGVRTYEGDTNSGSPFVYVPADNIDGTLTPNTDRADDTARITTDLPVIDKVRTTSVDEPGNAAANQATIGETISYTVTLDLPAGLSYYNAAITDNLSNEHDLIAGSVAATLDTVALPTAGLTLTVDDATNRWRIDFPATYSVAPGADQQIVVTFDAVVTDVASNVRNTTTNNRVDFDYQNVAGATRNVNDAVNTQIVEPNIVLDKADDDADGLVTSGQEIGYTLTVTNDNGVARVSTAHDTVVVDTVPDQLIVLDGPGGSPVADNGTVGPDNGTWDETARTITWTIDTIAPGASVDLDYAVTVADPIVAAAELRNTAIATTSSLDGAPTGERTSTSPNGGQGTGYQDPADNTVRVPVLELTKTGTPDTATVGETVTYTLEATVPGGVIAYDATVVDDLPAGITFESLVSVTCVEDGGACAPDIASVDVVPAAGPYATGDDIAFFIGDLLTPSADDRVVTIDYETFVADVVAADDGATLTNGAVLGWNTADDIAGTPTDVPAPGDFGSVTPEVDDDVDTVEPTLTIDKDVAGQNADDDNRRAVPGDVLTYTITVTNTGTSAAYDATVTDVVTDDTWAFVDTTVAAGVTNTDSDPVGGLEWTIDGPIAPNASVVITYTLTVPDTYDSSNEIVAEPEQVNTADIPSYWAVDETTRTANPDRDFREYDDVVEDVVEIELDLASIGDFVWFDVNDDGVQDPGEPVLADVTVTVTYHGPDGVLGGTDDEVFVVETDENGLYLVENLPGGQYTVDVDEADPDFLSGLAPSYDLDGGTAGPNGVWTGSLGEDQDRRDVDFGYTGTGTIGDTIWLDQDLDGVQDAGEAGLSGVDVTVTWHGPDGVLGGTDDIVYDTTTDANGNYLVEDLPAGAYTVTVDTDDIPADYVNVSDPDTANPGDSTSTLLLGPGASDLDQDFGYAGNGSIGDTIWLDTNGDGVQDVGETGLSGVVVEIVHGGPDGIIGNADDSLFTATTDENGNYLVENLPYGPYEVTVTGAITVLDNTGDPDGGGDNTSLTELTPAEPNDLDQDFGYQGTSVLGDRVWLDLNSDGVQDAGEPGLAGITVTATGPNDAVLVTTTDDAGNYLFPNIFDGEWTVTIDTDTLPDGLTPTGDDDGLGTPHESTTDLVTSDLDQDFGYAGPGRIGDTVWLDLDGDGTINGDEAGLGGVTVTLEWAQPSGPPIVLETTTAADGTYSFDNLPLGDYTVTVDTDTLPEGIAATFDFDGADDSTSDVTLTVDEPVRLDQDFGYQGAGAIGDTVWFDRNGDGVFDDDESPLPGVTVELVWDGPDGPETFTAVTDANGEYLFEKLAPGDYTVTVDTDTLPDGMVATFDADGGLDSTSSLTLADGEVNLDQDFGYQGAGSIGDTVWLDLDGDGVQGPNEPGIPGQTVELTWESRDGAVTYTTTTDENGNYLFDNLPPADYTVTVVGGIVDDAVNTGDPGDDGDSTNSITLADGEDDLDQDFGYQGINAIGDTVWYDVNADGIDDGATAEPRLEGVDVSVVWFGVDGIEGTDDDVTLPTTTTNVDGLYLVTGLPDGSYSVTVTDGVPAGLDTITYDGDGATADLDGTSIVTDLGVGVDAPAVDVAQDFGYTGSGSIGDTIWLDQNADGVVDPDESGIPGAEVTVTWAGPDGVLDTADDLVYPTVTTDENGNYLVEMLPAGPFRVDVANIPAGLSSTFDPDGGADGSSELTLDPGEDDLDQDFGYVGDASIGDTVFVDLDADGVQDLDEPGVPGVTVTVTSPGADGVLGTADDLVVVTVTDEAGQYLVDGLPAGTTTVSYDPSDLDDGYEPDSDLDGGDPTVTTVELEFGDEIRDVDFGIVGDASIDGTIWVDTDGDGVQDPNEPGIPGVDVIVTWDGPNGPVTVVVPTDEDGNWTLPTVPPGDYTVEVDISTVPPGFVATTPTDDTLSLPAGGSGNTTSGFVPAASIGDTIWNDVDADGVQDPGEPGLPGISVTLYDDSGEVVAITTTDADGKYLFDDLVPDTYTVVIDPNVLTSWTLTFDPDGGNDGRVTIDLDAGDERLDVDFGLVQRTLPQSGGGSGLVLPAALIMLAGAALLGLRSFGRRRTA